MSSESNESIILQIDEMGERVPPELDPKDERLLEEDYSDKTDVKRSMRYNASNTVTIC